MLQIITNRKQQLLSKKIVNIDFDQMDKDKNDATKRRPYDFLDILLLSKV